LSSACFLVTKINEYGEFVEALRLISDFDIETNCTILQDLVLYSPNETLDLIFLYKLRPTLNGSTHLGMDN